MDTPAYSAASWVLDPIPPAVWPDGSRLASDDRELYAVAATDACRVIAPTMAVNDTIPAGWVLAATYAARDLHAAAARGNTDIVGVGDLAFRVRTLSTVVRGLLRPEPAIPVVG